MVEKLNRAVDSRVAIGPNFVDHSGFPGYFLPHRTAEGQPLKATFEYRSMTKSDIPPTEVAWEDEPKRRSFHLQNTVHLIVNPLHKSEREGFFVSDRNLPIFRELRDIFLNIKT